MSIIAECDNYNSISIYKMNSSHSQHKLLVYSPKQPQQYQHHQMHKLYFPSSNQQTSPKASPLSFNHTQPLALTKQNIKLQPRGVQQMPKQYQYFRKDSIKSILHNRKESFRCQNDYIEQREKKQNIMDISEDLKLHNCTTSFKQCYTEKVISKNFCKDIKMDALQETSSTMKEIQHGNKTLNRKASFYPTNKSKGKSLFRQESKRNRVSLMFDRKLDGDCFDIIKAIGKGKYGKVFLVREKQTGFILALKAIQKKKILQANLLQQFLRQLKIQSYLDHPGIIKLYGLFCDPLNIYLLQELGCDGQLYDKICPNSLFSEQSSAFIARELLETVDYMHHHKILHRDIKPENIVVVLGNLKICDFGWAVYNDTEMRSTFCGTPMYFSPELLTKQEYDQKVDLWAVGVLIYELVVGKSPFNLKQPKDLGRIVTHHVDFPRYKSLSLQFKNFIQKILEKNPQYRPTSKQLLETKFIRKYRNLQICEELCKAKEASTNKYFSNYSSKEKNRQRQRQRDRERTSQKKIGKDAAEGSGAPEARGPEGRGRFQGRGPREGRDKSRSMGRDLYYK